MKHNLNRWLGPVCSVVIASFLLTGCATNPAKKLAQRKQERYDAYSSLSPDFKAAVDQGQIKVGMPMDAVYIAWGKPAQVLNTESAQGAFTTWLYQGSQLREQYYWTRHNYMYRGRYGGSPYLATDYQAEYYVSAEVFFEKGVVKEWRTLPAPPH
jgi:hypothetical protein